MKRFIISILIIIVFINSLALTLFFVVHSHYNFSSIRDRDIEDIEQQVVNRLGSFHIIMEPFEAEVREYSENALMELYQKLTEGTEGMPFSIDDDALREMVQVYDGVDVYLIDPQGIVVQSTFESDIGLNLLDMEENFSGFIQSIYGKDKVFTQRMGISNMQGTKMIYSYFSPEGSEWIIETSVSFEEYMRLQHSDTLYTHLFETFFTEIQTANSNIVGFDIIYQTNVSSRSLITGKEVPVDEEVLQALDKGVSFRRQEDESLHIYRKRHMKRSGFDFVLQYPIIFLEYDLSYYYDFIAKFYLIAGLSMLVLIVLSSGVSYKLVEMKLVRRIEELDEVLQRAAYEDYSVRVRYASRVPELMTLASSTNRLIEQVKTREGELRLALEEREMLLEEIHHRVKNNLNVVISLLNLQREKVRTVEDVKNALLKTRNRIYSMALTHEKLYQSDNFTDVNMKTYIESFLSTFTTSIDNHSRIEIKSMVDEINLSITHAVPCGIILNELLMNAVQHAFPSRQDGVITVSFGKTQDDRYKLTVEDNGVGLPPDFSPDSTDSLGLILVDALIKQLHGTLTIDSNAGTRFVLVFKGGGPGAAG